MRARVGFVVAAVAVVSAAAVPIVQARPSVDVAWRAEPDVLGVAVDAAGRVYTVATDFDHGRARGVLRAYAADGSLRWERIWRPADAAVHAWDVTVGPGGAVIVSGSINHVEGCDEIWGWGWAVRAWGTDGDVRWQRLQPGWASCDVFGTSARAVAAAGDTVALAVSHGHEYGSWGYVLALDADGRRRWMREIDPPGSVNESVADVAVGADGSVYVAASRNLGALDEPERDQDAILVKLGPDGVVRWIRRAPDAAAGGEDDTDRGTGVAIGRSGISFASVLGEGGTTHRARLASYAPDGDLRWQRFVPWVSGYRWTDAFVGARSDGSALATVERDDDGAGSHLMLRGFDGAGDHRWAVRLGPLDDRFWGPTAMDARGDAIVVSGRPAREEIWSRVWLLAG